MNRAKQVKARKIEFESVRVVVSSAVSNATLYRADESNAIRCWAVFELMMQMLVWYG